MDLHPLVIHYPIAFLTTYAVFELMRFRRLLDLPYWFYVKATLVIVGEIGAVATAVAARLPTSTLSENSVLSEVYKDFALIAAVVFAAIALAYIFEWFWPTTWGFSRVVLRPIVILPLTVAGLFFIVVAGGFFGATVYGTHFDPYLLGPIFKLLNVY